MPISFIHPLTHQVHTSEREEKFTQVGDREVAKEHLHILGFTFAIGARSISEEVVGFSPLWFPRGNFFLCLLSLVIIVVHVILSDKILHHIE